MGKMANSGKWAQKNISRIADHLTTDVTQANDRVYIHLERRTCDCGHFQEYGIPCGHAFSLIYTLGQSPRAYVPDPITLTAWQNTYLTNLQPINIEELTFAGDCSPPIKRRPAG